MSRLKQRAFTDRENTIRPILLGELQRRAIDVQCWCNRCPHHAILASLGLVAQHGHG